MDYRQIGETLGMEVNTVRSRLHRARHALADQLQRMAVE
jgi:DNA-directed RNA polymerase specialized sigma24 family protein